MRYEPTRLPMAADPLGEAGKYAEVGGSDTLRAYAQTGRSGEASQAAVSARNVETDQSEAWDSPTGTQCSRKVGAIVRYSRTGRLIQPGVTWAIWVCKRVSV